MNTYFSNRMRTWTTTATAICLSLLFVVPAVTLAQGQNTMAPVLVGLSVQDLDESIAWYTTKLGFTLRGDQHVLSHLNPRRALLQNGNFTIELVAFDPPVERTEVIPDEDTMLGGLFKIGFVTNNLENLFDRLSEYEDVDFVTDIGTLPPSDMGIPWPQKYFLVRDSDGNFVQFFELGTSNQLIPWLFMVTVEDLVRSMAWYGDYLGYTHIQTIGEPGNRRSILSRDGHVLELFEPAKVVTANQLSVENPPIGFTRLGLCCLEVEKYFSLEGPDKVQPVSVHEENMTAGAGRTWFVQDIEGNRIQLFEAEN